VRWRHVVRCFKGKASAAGFVDAEVATLARGRTDKIADWLRSRALCI
jgi:hypothetical protein